MLWMRKVRGSNSGLVKSDIVTSTVCHHCYVPSEQCSSGAKTYRRATSLIAHFRVMQRLWYQNNEDLTFLIITLLNHNSTDRCSTFYTNCILTFCFRCIIVSFMKVSLAVNRHCPKYNSRYHLPAHTKSLI